MVGATAMPAERLPVSHREGRAALGARYPWTLPAHRPTVAAAASRSDRMAVAVALCGLCLELGCVYGVRALQWGVVMMMTRRQQPVD